MNIFFRDFTDDRNKELVNDACEEYNMIKDAFNSVCDLQYNSYADEDRKATLDTIKAIMKEKKKYWLRTDQYDETDNHEVYSCESNFKYFLDMINDFFFIYDDVLDEILENTSSFSQEVHDNKTTIRKLSFDTRQEVIAHHKRQFSLLKAA